jgi:hypothetical protein
MSSSGSVPDGYYSRGNSMSSYVVPQSRYYAVSSFSEYPEENVSVDYGVQASPYPILASDQLIPQNFPPTNRGWTPAPQMAKTTPIYLEQDPNYNNVPYHNAYQLRPTISPESKSSIHPVSIPIGINGTSLPPLPAGGTDRVLPFPATRTALPTQVGSYMRSTTVPHPGYHHSYDGIISSNGLPTSKTISNNSLPGSTTLPPDAYMPYSSSSPESLASSTQTAYSTQQLSQQLSQQQADLYASGSDALYNSSDTAESSYGPSSEKRGSQSSQEALSQDGSIPSILSGSGLLSNGHAYTPFNSGTQYPQPPMDMPAPTPTRGGSAITRGISSS